MITCKWLWPGVMPGGTPFNLCGCPECPAYKKTVTDACCAACPLLEVGVADGARDAFKPLWPECDRREKIERTEPCGCKYKIAKCQHPKSEHFGQEIRPKDCRACPLKQVQA